MRSLKKTNKQQQQQKKQTNKETNKNKQQTDKQTEKKKKMSAWGVHPLRLSVQYFTCRPRRLLPFKMSLRTVLERPSWSVICADHARFPLLDSRWKRLLWAHTDFALYIAVDRALRVQNADNSPQALGLKGLALFFFFFVFRISKATSTSHSHIEGCKRQET